MTNFKNDKFYTIADDKQSIPVSASGTGTISTTGKAVKGVGTLFMSELRMGSWLVDLTQNEVRKVIRTESNTLVFLDNAFTVNIAALTTPNIISNTKLNIRQISVSIDPALANGEIDGTVLLAGAALEFGKPSDNSRNSFAFIDPLIADATGTEIQVTILK